MTEELTAEQKLELAEAIKFEDGTVLFDACHLTVKDKHIVAECDSIKASEALALLLTEDVFIRIKPKAPVTEAELDTLTES